TLVRYGHFIGGARVAPSSDEYLPTENPYTGEVWGEIARGTRADAEAAVESAHAAFVGPWAALTASERGRLLWRLGDLVAELAAGCTAVVKPSEFTSASMIEFAQLFTDAGFPAGVVNVVTGLGPEVGEALVTHRHVAHIGFTGGSAAGRKIYELAARNLKTV